MLKRLIAITVIFIGAGIAWMILGGTLVQRTGDSDSTQRAKLTAQWGGPQAQNAPSVQARVARDTYNQDKKRAERAYQTIAVPLRSSRIDVKLDLEQRRVGLLWYNLYSVRFAARYRVRNDTPSSQLSVHFAFPSSQATYADFNATVGGRRIADPAALDSGYVSFDLPPGRETTIAIGYSSRGMETWSYCFGSGVQSINDFALAMTTNFDAIDFPSQTLLPVDEVRSGKGWRLGWHYTSLVTGNSIGMTFPYPLQPGPLAQRITLWAPVALFFYFFVMLVITTLRNVDLHPVNYFFSGRLVLCVPLALRVSGRPHCARGGLRDLLGRHTLFDDLVSAARRRLALCRRRKRARAARVSHSLLVRIVQRRMERADDYHRRHHHAFRRDAGYGPDQVERAARRRDAVGG